MTFMFLVSAVVAQFSVVEVYPNRHATGISVASDLQFIFSEEPDVATINDANITVRGSESGVRSVSYTVDSSIIRIHPAQDFHEGESVYVYLSTGIESGGTPLSGPWMSQFTVASSPGYPVSGTSGNTATSNVENVQRVVPADINGDGHMDLVTGSLDDDKVAWFESNGAVPPQYTEHVVSTATIGVSDVCVGDINNDGDIDIIGASPFSNSITWFRNNGGSNPTFDAFEISITVDGVTSVTTGDMDGDGDLDVLTASPDDNTVAWFEHNGNLSSPSFTKLTISTAPSGYGPYRVTTGDIDNDGHRDVIVAFNISNRVSWYRNNGAMNPVFALNTVGTSINLPADVEVGDMDGDGDLDVVTSSQSGEWTRWYENNFPSAFTWQLVSSGGSGITDIALVDIDGDCDLDILRTSSGDDMVSCFRNDGQPNPAFSGFAVSSTSLGVTSVSGADLTGDGIMNIIASAADSDQILWYNTQPVPKLTSTTPTYSAIDVSASTNIVLQFDTPILASSVNLNSIVVTGSYSGLIAGTFSGGGTNTITFNPTADFLPGEIISVTSSGQVQSLDTLPAVSEHFNFTVATGFVQSPSDLVDRSVSGESAHLTSDIRVFDLNGDGHLDVFVNRDPIGFDDYWYQNDGAANPIFTQMNLDDLDLGFFDLGDLDGDGSIDFAGVRVGSADKSLRWIENSGGGPPFTFHIIELNIDNTRGVRLGDIDQDGDLDIVVLTTNEMMWYENDGTSTPQFTIRVISTWGGYAGNRHLRLVDLNNDGDLDILTTSGPFVHYWENDCGNFNRRLAGDTPFAYDDIIPADMDGDGDPDILAFQHASESLHWFRNNGGQEPTFSPIQIALGSGEIKSIVPLDYDADGDLDVMCARGALSQISMFRNDGNPDPGFAPVDLFTHGFFLLDHLAAGDLDGDGDVDLTCIIGSTIHWLELHPQFLLTSTNPSAHDIQVLPNTAITLNFNFPVENASVNADNIKVYGSQSGLMTGAFSGGGTNVITFTPSSSFAFGEQVSVTYSAQLLHEEFSLTNPGVLNFTISVNPVSPAATVYSSHTLVNGSDEVRDVACADLDGDGDVDVIRVISDGLNITWYRNSGSSDPSFSGFSISNTVSDARSVATADVNQDGHVDIVIASADDNKVAWYQNTGGAPPTFNEHIVSTGASGAQVVSTGDIDHDGDLDIIVGAMTGGAIYWYKNSGGGSPSFSQQTASSNSNGVSDIVIADVNGDGLLDILASEYSGSAAVWYRNNGEFTPTFTRILVGDGYPSMRAVCAGDLDSDGDLDIIGGTETGNHIGWFENDGAISPGFTHHSIMSGTSGSLSITAGDIDADNDLDITVTLNSTGNLKVLVNDGSTIPGFSELNITQTAIGVSSVALGDLDGDGDNEFITGSSSYPDVAWYNTQNSLKMISHYPDNQQINRPRNTNVTLLMDALVDPPTLTEPNIALHGSQSGWIQATIDGTTESIIIDPSEDLFPGEHVTATITSGLTKEGFPLTNPQVFGFDVDGLAHLNPVFYKHVIGDPVSNPTEIILADINGDGHLDVIEASATSDTIAWHENNGAFNPLFARNVIPSTTDSITSISTADVDMDGDIDIIVSSYLDDRITWLENSGGSIPTFTEQVINSATDGASALATGDLDRDGDIDIASVAHLGGEVAWFENDGSSQPVFTKHVLSTTSQGANAIQLYDWDNDGDLDIIRSANISANVSLFENNGADDPTFTSSVIWANTSPGDFHVVDIDANGLPDIFAAYPANGLLLMLYNTPNGMIPVLIDNNAGGVTDVTSADFNGDGIIDILAAQPNYNRVVNYRNNGNSPPGFAPISVVLGIIGVTKLAFGDLDGDGDADLATTLTPLDQVTWYEMDFQKETLVSALNGMLIIEDINGGNSIDNITLSADGPNLLVHCPGSSVLAAGYSCSLVDEFTAQIPFDSVNGCRIEFHNGADVLNINTDLTVADSGFIVNDAHHISQNGTVLTSLSGDILLEAEWPGSVNLNGTIIASDSTSIIVYSPSNIVNLRGFISSEYGNVNIFGGTLNVNEFEGSGILSTSGEIDLTSGVDLNVGRNIISIDSSVVNMFAWRDIYIKSGVHIQVPSGQLQLHGNEDILLQGSGAISSTSADIIMDAGQTITISKAVSSLSGDIIMESIRNVVINDTISTVSGDITIHANLQEDPTAGNFDGILVNTNAAVTTESGSIELWGRGGDQVLFNIFNAGLMIRGSVMSTGTSFNAGSIDLNGWGGSYDFAPGNGVFNFQGLISIIDGELNILGVSGTRLLDPDPPVPPGHVVNFQGTIEALGTANINISTE